jgi:hypothetical protein
VSDFTEILDAEARRYALNMIALWAAQQLGKSGDEANDFAQEFIAKNASDEPHTRAFDRLCQLLVGKGLCTKEEVLRKMNEHGAIAQACFGTEVHDTEAEPPPV